MNIARPLFAIAASAGLVLSLGACSGAANASGETQTGSAASGVAATESGSAVDAFQASQEAAQRTIGEISLAILNAEELLGKPGTDVNAPAAAELQAAIDDASNGLNQDLPTMKADATDEELTFAADAMDVALTALEEHLENLNGAITAYQATLK